MKNTSNTQIIDTGGLNNVHSIQDRKRKRCSVKIVTPANDIKDPKDRASVISKLKAQAQAQVK